MKYTRIALILLCCVTAAMAVDRFVPETSTVPAIDGDLSTGWDDALTFRMEAPEITQSPVLGTIVSFDPDNDADLSADVYVKWDATNLYLAVEVADQSLNWLQPASGPFNNQDCAQMVFNLNENPAAVYLDDAPIYDFVPQTSDSAGPVLYKHDGSMFSLPNASIDGDVLANGYTVELAIPWSDFDGYVPAVGDRHGFGVILVDYDFGFLETLMFDFGAGQSVINTPGAWNSMILVGADGCGEDGFHAGDVNADCYVDLNDFAELAAFWGTCTQPGGAGCVNVN